MYQLSVEYELLPNFCVELWGFLLCFLIYLRSWPDFYATTGRSGRAKYQLWQSDEGTWPDQHKDNDKDKDKDKDNDKDKYA